MQVSKLDLKVQDPATWSRHWIKDWIGWEKYGGRGCGRLLSGHLVVLLPVEVQNRGQSDINTTVTRDGEGVGVLRRPAMSFG